MKIDRFWTIQFIIIGLLLALLLGSYGFSFGWFAAKPRPSNTATHTPIESQPQTPRLAATVCAPADATLDVVSIAASLTGNDTQRQQDCLNYLRQESAAGDKGAELWLGRAYHDGWGVNKDLAQAAAHYRQAASASEADIRTSAQQWLQRLEQEQP